MENILVELLDPRKLADDELVFGLKRLVRTERKITAEILTYINEVERRQVFLKHDCTSLFAFLTKEIGYTKAAAQRRIESARILWELPQLKEDLVSGELNLSQVSLVAQCVRQKQKEAPEMVLNAQDKKELLELVKNQDLDETQKIVAQKLDLDVKVVEKKRIQQDESVRIEITLTKAQAKVLERARELLSHSHPKLSFAELVTVLAQNFVQRKDPAVVRASRGVPDAKSATEIVGSAPEPRKLVGKPSFTRVPFMRVPLTAARKRHVFRSDQCCQWKNLETGEICGSRFQLQVDHIKAVWLGGGNEQENLQLLCSVHNSYKYKLEAKAHAMGI